MICNHSEEEIKTLIDHFASVLADETRSGALDQWLDLKTLGLTGNTKETTSL